MMTPTTEYQTEKEETYRATDRSDKKLKFKNPLKMPVALLPPDRNVINFF